MARPNSAGTRKRVLITGSTTGLGLLDASRLVDEGHHVVLHARDRSRANDLGPLAERSAGVVIGDLAEVEQIRAMADDVNALGPLDAVIHNAGIYTEPRRNPTALGLPRVIVVNVVAPYLLTVRIAPPRRLVYLSSGMHTGGRSSLDDLAWTRRRWSGVQAYSDSKLLVTTVAMAVARRRPDVLANAVDPGWVPTRMGGPSAPDDLTLGYETQVWLATSDDPGAMTSGRYWFHGAVEEPAPVVDDVEFQDELLHRLEAITGVRL